MSSNNDGLEEIVRRLVKAADTIEDRCTALEERLERLIRKLDPMSEEAAREKVRDLP